MQETLTEAAGLAARAGYRPDIDGLRAVAVVSVIFFHAGLPGVHAGFTGVDVFFVISGFLIGGFILKGVSSDQFTFTGFYARRARRILPALLLVLGFSALTGAFLLSPVEFSRLGKSIATALCGVSNIGFWLRVDYFSEYGLWNPALMTWSLGVEEQFYVVFPVLMVILARRSQYVMVATLSVIVAVSFALS